MTTTHWLHQLLMVSPENTSTICDSISNNKRTDLKRLGAARISGLLTKPKPYEHCQTLTQTSYTTWACKERANKMSLQNVLTLFGCSNLLKKGIQGLVATKRKTHRKQGVEKIHWITSEGEEEECTHLWHPMLCGWTPRNRLEKQAWELSCCTCIY